MLSLVGIRPQPSSIGPPGIHLRWTFTPELGFPREGFKLFRRPAGAKVLVFAKITPVPTGSIVPAGTVLDGIRIEFPDGGSVRGAPGSGLEPAPQSSAQRLALSFAEPVGRVLLRLDLSSAVTVSAFVGRRKVAETPVQTGTNPLEAELEWAGIMRIELPLNFDRLRELEY
jgi:hypothetical protein